MKCVPKIKGIFYCLLNLEVNLMEINEIYSTLKKKVFRLRLQEAIAYFTLIVKLM